MLQATFKINSMASTTRHMTENARSGILVTPPTAVRHKKALDEETENLRRAHCHKATRKSAMIYVKKNKVYRGVVSDSYAVNFNLRRHFNGATV